jgi:catechol 2,3-dioxygenase-like lactoylglutathione lyase family enzyme
VKIDHLALAVADPQRSARFYLDTLGLAGRAFAEDWGVRVRVGDDFMLALIRGEPVPADVVGRVHLGCALPDPDAARRLRERLRAAGVRELEWEEEAGYTGVKIADPDGYVVELFHEGP